MSLYQWADPEPDYVYECPAAGCGWSVQGPAEMVRNEAIRHYNEKHVPRPHTTPLPPPRRRIEGNRPDPETAPKPIHLKKNPVTGVYE